MLIERFNGWAGRETLDCYIIYVKEVLRRFADQVTWWFAFTEPNIPIDNGYMDAIWYPFTHDPKTAYQAHFHKILADVYKRQYHMSEGPMAQNMLGLYNFDRAFIGCAGMDPISGQCYTAEMGTRELKEIAMKNSNHSYLLIDDSKLFVKGFCKFTNADAFEQIFCNRLDETVENLPDNMKFVE